MGFNSGFKVLMDRVYTRTEEKSQTVTAVYTEGKHLCQNRIYIKGKYQSVRAVAR